MPILLSPRKERVLPIVPLREGVIFPHIETILNFGRPISVAAVEAAFNSDRLACFLSQKDSKVDEPTKDDLYQIGTLGRIERLLRTESELYAWVKGISRVRFESLEAVKPFMVGRVVEIPEISESSDEITALTNNLIKNFQEAINLGKAVDVMMVMRLLGENTPPEVADQISYILDLKTADKQALLETFSLKERLIKATEYLAHELKVLELERAIDSKTRKKFDKLMRENILRERKRVIEEELGEVTEEEDEIKELKQKIQKAKMPPEVEKKAQKELKRLSGMNPNHPEFAYIRTYLDWLTEMPWSVSTPNKVSIAKAAKILDEDHWGLEKVKERVVEYLAVMKLREKQKNKEGGPTILCFVGPPGVGKTSIGKSIARALGRKFVRISLGGIRDEAEIRGHRRTYVGAMPGRIIQGIRNAGTNNPVFMLDEIDKVGTDFRGDPSAALLEALDPEQNHEFSDHYLEVPFDLSRVMFITTANILDTIPPALRDRMETIHFPGYTELEKFHIAKKYLWNKQLVFNGLKKDEIKIADGAIYEIIRRYTREAGVRELERCLATICRKLARKVAEKKKIPKIVEKSDIHKYLGPRKYTETLAEKKDGMGIATGLAYTEAGGDILFIEVALMPGRGNLLLTGKLGEVMKESGKAALSYVRSRWEQLGLKKDFYKNLDIHIHIPEGAIPKDGPSAGVAITVALVSALTKTPTRMDTGMTGEITLRGRVLEIGGVKEKVIAAHRAGLKRVILPKENKKDLVDVPGSVKKDIKFIFVSHMDEVLKLALRSKDNGRD
ncbi:MAG: endopeptidase La [Microgenomates group bacterium]